MHEKVSLWNFNLANTFLFPSTSLQIKCLSSVAIYVYAVIVVHCYRDNNPLLLGLKAHFTRGSTYLVLSKSVQGPIAAELLGPRGKSTITILLDIEYSFTRLFSYFVSPYS